MDAAIEVEHVSKRFGTTLALDDVSLEVESGKVLALLGPNGAGKTTLVRVLTTLLQPDSGRASVAGFDVGKDAKTIRTMIGLAGQYATVDELLTGRENLELVGLLYHLDKSEYERRARRGPRTDDARRSGRQAGQDLLGRDEATTRPGGQPHRSPADPLSR